jgi:hypothetical protein
MSNGIAQTTESIFMIAFFTEPISVVEPGVITKERVVPGKKIIDPSQLWRGC